MSERIETERLRDFHTELARLLLRGDVESVRSRLLAEGRDTENYDPREGLKRVVEIAQDMSIPRDPSRGGLRTTVRERAATRRMFQPIPQPTEVDRLLQRKMMERQVGMLGVGGMSKRSISEAMMVDYLMAQNPSMTRDEAKVILRRLLRPVDSILSQL